MLQPLTSDWSPKQAVTGWICGWGIHTTAAATEQTRSAIQLLLIIRTPNIWCYHPLSVTTICLYHIPSSSHFFLPVIRCKTKINLIYFSPDLSDKFSTNIEEWPHQGIWLRKDYHDYSNPCNLGLRNYSSYKDLCLDR